MNTTTTFTSALSHEDLTNRLARICANIAAIKEELARAETAQDRAESEAELALFTAARDRTAAALDAYGTGTATPAATGQTAAEQTATFTNICDFALTCNLDATLSLNAFSEAIAAAVAAAPANLDTSAVSCELANFRLVAARYQQWRLAVIAAAAMATGYPTAAQATALSELATLYTSDEFERFARPRFEALISCVDELLSTGVNTLGASDWALVKAYDESDCFEDAVELFEARGLDSYDAADAYLHAA